MNGKHILIVDDLTESASTLIESAKMCKDHGAAGVYCAISHGCFTNTGHERLMEAFSTGLIKQLFTSNSVNTGINWGPYDKYINIVDVSSVFAKVILNIHNNASVSELFK